MKIEIKRFQIYAVILYLFFLSFLNFTPIYLIAVAILIGVSCLKILKNNKITITSYVKFEIFLIIYNLMYVIFGITINSEHTIDVIKTLTLNFIINFFIINSITTTNDLNSIFKSIIRITVFSSIYAIIYSLVYGLGENGRLMHGVVRPLGNSVYSSMEFASWAVYACTICIYLYMHEKNKKYLLVIPLFWTVILLSGSRKWLFFGFLLQFAVYIYCSPIKDTKRLLKKILIILFIIIIGIFLIFNNSKLYSTIGNRITGYFTKSESSSLSRNYFAETAMNYIKLKPWFGYGLNTFRDINKYKNWSEVNFLELAFGGGLILVFIYYFYIFHLIYCLFLNRKKNNLNILLMFILLMISISDIISMSYLQRLEQFFIAISSISLVLEGVDNENIYYNA